MRKPGPQPLGDGKYPLTMGNALEHFRAQPFTKLSHPFLIAGRAEMPAFAGKGQQVFITAVMAPDPGKAVVKVTAV